MGRPGRAAFPLVALLLLGSGCAHLDPAGSAARERTPAASLAPSAATSTPSAGPVRVDPPDGLPVPPGALALPLPADDPVLAVRWTTPRDGAEVYAFLLEEIPAAGFVVTGAYPGGTAAIITFTDGGGDAWQVALYGVDPLTIDVRRDA